MAEFDEKLNALLGDSAAMAQIMQLAQSLSSEHSAPPPSSPPPSAPPPSPAAEGFNLSGVDPAMLGKLLPLLQGGGSDSDSAQLLHALRPFLTPERQGKVDRALQLARMIHLGKQLFSIWGT